MYKYIIHSRGNGHPISIAAKTFWRSLGAAARQYPRMNEQERKEALERSINECFGGDRVEATLAICELLQNGWISQLDEGEKLMRRIT